VTTFKFTIERLLACMVANVRLEISHCNEPPTTAVEMADERSFAGLNC
jgi:hypothetical protein